jgi:K+-sensing histidine kinase KdpD
MKTKNITFQVKDIGKKMRRSDTRSTTEVQYTEVIEIPKSDPYGYGIAKRKSFIIEIHNANIEEFNKYARTGAQFYASLILSYTKKDDMTNEVHIILDSFTHIK